MIKKLIKNKYQVLELIIIFIITLLFSLVCNTLVHDEIWIYGFSYNISTGLIPYKDFNMVITPLYPLLGAIFMNIFGKNIIVYHVFNSIICTTIFYYIKKSTSKSYYIVYSIFLFFCLPNYNILCLLFLYILMNMEDKNSNDYLMGFTLGLAFLTKQNIGIYLTIPTLFTKNMKKIIKRIIGFIVPLIFLLIYLLYNNTLYEFIDYTILGISDFAKQNTVVHFSCLIFTIISIIYLIYQYIKTKDLKLIYLLCFQGMAYPLVDPHHVMIPFLPVLAHFLSGLKLDKKILSYAFIVFIIGIFSYNIYQYNTESYSYPNTTSSFKYRKLNNRVAKDLDTIATTIKYTEGNIYIIDMYAYLIKLELEMPINKYDLLNNGNLGKDGEIKIISEIDKTCKEEKCTFFINQLEIGNRISQYNQDILRYVVNNYTNMSDKDIDAMGLSVYKNH